MATPSSSQHNESVSETNLTKYLSLYKAILKGDLKTVIAIHHEDPFALEARITENLDTALHVAVGTGKVNHIVEYLLSRMSLPDLSMRNSDGDTVLSIAAIVGNIPAAKMIVKKQPNLTTIANHNGWVPLLEAARHGQKDIISCLLEVSGDYLQPAEASPDKPGFFFMNLLVIAGIYDLALELVQTHPGFATVQYYGGESLLSAVAAKPSSFPSGRQFRFWQRLVHRCVPMELTNMKLAKANPMDIENPTAFQIRDHLYRTISSVPRIKEVADMKLVHHQTLELVKRLCKEIVTSLDHSKACSILKRPFLLAAQFGIHEMVEEIVESFPHAVWLSDTENHNVFQIAVLNRQEKVFNLIYQMSDYRNLLLVSQDTSGNNILQLAGKMAPQHRLNLISGAALQMQHELQWFKEVEKIVQPAYKENKNSEGKTPAMVFTEEHRILVKQGEKWMKGTATSCTVAATLIATVVFAAAITIPGGTNNNGNPIFYDQKAHQNADQEAPQKADQNAFAVFAIADALSLYLSIASILMFLSILTARYSEADFLYALPKRLIFGLVTLFLSITSLMVAFSASVYLLFCNGNPWILIPMGLLAGLPVSLFASLQFPLLVYMIYSTYRPGIFGKKSERMLH